MAREQNIIQENKTIVRRWFEEGWQRQDMVSGVNEFFHPSYTAHHFYQAPVRGAAPVAEEVLWVRAAFPDIRFTVEDQIAEGIRW